MAFLINNFSPLGSNSRRGNAPQHFSYITEDSVSSILAFDTYFLEIYSMLSAGDIISTIVVDSVSNPTSISQKIDLVIISSDNTNGVVVSPADTDFFSLNAYMPDVSTAGSVWAPGITSGTALLVIGVLGGTIATANAAITIKIDATTVGSTNITAAGSAAGDVILIPLFSSPNVSGSSQPIEIETDGASTNTVPIQWTVVVSSITQ